MDAAESLRGVQRLLELMTRLRDPACGCPWDLEQDFASLAPYTVEEAYEVDHAIRLGDMTGLREELGDLLLQVVFHAQLAREAGHFDFDGVVAGLCEKLVARHPHVFAGERVGSAAEQRQAWDRIKARERGGAGLFEGIPQALPALARAAKLLGRAEARVEAGAAAVAPACDEVAAALAVCRSGEASAAAPALGELLFACVRLARALEVDPEQSLRDVCYGFEKARAPQP